MLIASIFTFHYGSILMSTIGMIAPVNTIYIPLWFYSNIFSAAEELELSKFTFHYGSILIRCTDISYAAYKNMVELSTLFFLLLKILKNMALYDEEHQK